MSLRVLPSKIFPTTAPRVLFRIPVTSASKCIESTHVPSPFGSTRRLEV